MNVRAAVDPLVTAKVIGDVIDKFVPAAELTVQYESTPEANGCDINPSSAVEKPHVHISGSRGSPNYTLVIPQLLQTKLKSSFCMLIESNLTWIDCF